MNITDSIPGAALEKRLAEYDDLLVAFSGGVDSAVLLAAAKNVLGDRVVALTADSPSLPRHELREAIELAESLSVTHLVVSTGEMESSDYTRNDRQRCYWCKHSLFETCDRIARERGFTNVAYGYTADDVGDFRPGHRAAGEFKVRAPLFDAGLGKREIRELARAYGMRVWDKPAAPCLSSRIPYGSAVTMEKLSQIESMENLLHSLGFEVARARFDGELMRIELEAADIPRAASPETRRIIVDKARDLGIPLVTLDLEGFASGKLNRT